MNETKAAIAGGWKAVAKALEANMNALLEENRKLRGALEQVEYVAIGSEGMDGFSHCPWCEQFSDEPHAEDCTRQTLLKPQGGD